MKTKFHIPHVVAALVFLAPALRAASVTNVLPSGAKAMFVLPDKNWNGDLILFAHGYTDTTQPLDFQDLQFGSYYLPDLATELHFAFATTSYRKNGLAVLEGVQDLLDLVRYFPAEMHVTPRRVIIIGASEGGLVTTLSLEQYPEVYAGGLAMCGPIGDFKKQTDYLGNFRTLFDYFYPGLLPGNTTNAPPELAAHWYDVYQPLIDAALAAAPEKALQLIATAHAAIDTNDASTVVDTANDLLWYNAFATTDAGQELRGNPYGNVYVNYRGSTNDTALNAGVMRYQAQPRALLAEQPYETSGRLSRPLVTLHTTGDDVVPFWHEMLYAGKVKRNGSGAELRIIPVRAYGHCNFGIGEFFSAFAILLDELKP